MSSDEMEDLDFPAQKRRKLTKNQQLYGIFADDQDDEEQQSKSQKKDKYGFSIGIGGGGSGQGKSTTSKGMNFIKSKEKLGGNVLSKSSNKRKRRQGEEDDVDDMDFDSNEEKDDVDDDDDIPMSKHEREEKELKRELEEAQLKMGGGAMKHQQQQHQQQQQKSQQKQQQKQQQQSQPNQKKGGIGFSKQNEKKEEEEEEEEGRGRGGLGSGNGGLGFGGVGVGVGLGFSKQSTKKETNEEEYDPDHPDDDETTTTTSTSNSNKQKPQQNQTQQSQTQQKKKLGFQFGTGSTRGSLTSQASFEKHTKGIGSKLLKGMGWNEGEGLGAGGQGINKPIEVKQRGGRIGLGFIDEKTDQQKEDEEATRTRLSANKSFVVDEDDLQSNDYSSKPQQSQQSQQKTRYWKKGSKKREKYVLPSDSTTTNQQTQQEGEVDEGDDDGGGDGPTSTIPLKKNEKIVITDMRGEQAKVITDLSQISSNLNQQQSISDFLPEIQHNLSLLADQTSADLLTSQRKSASEKQKVKNLQIQLDEQRLRLKEEEQRMKKIEEISTIISQLEKQVKSGKATMEMIGKSFTLLRSRYSNEFRHFKLYLLASALVFPILKRKLSTWDPLNDPTLAISEMDHFRKLTATTTTTETTDSNESDEIEVYTQLICDLILPKIRNAIVNVWKPREKESSERLRELLFGWFSIVPESVEEYICESLLEPKLRREVEEWDPRKDSNPIDQWLLRWSLYLPEHSLQTLFPIIRQKLSQIILQSKWNARDVSVHALISPWREVWENQKMEVFLASTIMPSLNKMMSEFRIDPSHQDEVSIPALLIWQDLLPSSVIVSLLEKEFFPKFHQVLFSWLQSKDVDFEEVMQWFSQWKQVFHESSEKLENDDRVRAHFMHSLQMMNSAASGDPLPSNAQPSDQEIFESAQRNQQERGAGEREKGNESKSTKTTFVPELTFKQMVEQYLEQNEMSLIPTSKRHEGHQVYNVGKNQVYLDNSVLFRFDTSSNRWQPTDFHQLSINGIKK